jgi:hypothetical protein
MARLPGPTNKKPWEWPFPKSFHSPDKLGPDFSCRFPTSLPTFSQAFSEERSHFLQPFGPYNILYTFSLQISIVLSIAFQEGEKERGQIFILDRKKKGVKSLFLTVSPKAAAGLSLPWGNGNSYPSRISLGGNCRVE